MTLTEKRKHLRVYHSGAPPNNDSHLSVQTLMEMLDALDLLTTCSDENHYGTCRDRWADERVAWCNHCQNTRELEHTEA